MQAAKVKDLPKRSRYYQGNIDANTLEEGGLFRDLKNSYVIFICCFDPFKEGRLKYTFKNYCEENKELCLNDGAVKIFLNTKGKSGEISKALSEFLKYTENSTDSLAETSESGLVKTIHTRVKQIKENERLGANYMTMIMRDRVIHDEGRAEGMAEGKYEGKREERLSIALEMLKNSFPVDLISQLTKLSNEEIVNLKNNLALA